MSALYDVYYVEEVLYRFSYEAENAEDAAKKFQADYEEGCLDFSDGEVGDGHIDRIENHTEERLRLNVRLYIARMFPEYHKHPSIAGSLIEKVVEEVIRTEEFEDAWNNEAIAKATVRVLLKQAGHIVGGR